MNMSSDRNLETICVTTNWKEVERPRINNVTPISTELSRPTRPCGEMAGYPDLQGPREMMRERLLG